MYDSYLAAVRPDGAKIGAPIAMAVGVRKCIYVTPIAEDK